MYEPNIYVNNNKFMSIIDNVSILQLPPDPWSPFYTTENLPKLTVFNNISLVVIIRIDYKYQLIFSFITFFQRYLYNNLIIFLDDFVLSGYICILSFTTAIF